jgi:nitrite reductase (cytochrome c-552)
VGNPTPNVAQSDATPAPDKYGVVKATQWAEAYPYEYESYLANASNTPPAEDYLDNPYVAEGYASKTEDVTSALPEGYKYVDAKKMDYLETNPEIKILGKGYGYAKYYTEPASHVYSLWTVTHNGRVGDGTKTKAACITCKSPQYSNLVDKDSDIIIGVVCYEFLDVNAALPVHVFIVCRVHSEQYLQDRNDEGKREYVEYCREYVQYYGPGHVSAVW